MRALIYICLFCFVSLTWAQSVPGNPHGILCDRSLYLAGEHVYFRVFNTGEQKYMDPQLNKVYYLELISWDGSPLVQAKFPLDSTGSRGTIRIPSDITSGIYYLKGYTKWMRQEGPEAYNYIELTIVNTGSKKVLPVDMEQEATVKMDYPDIQAAASGLLQTDLSGDFDRRSALTLSLSNTSPVAMDLSLSTVNRGLLEQQRVSIPLFSRSPGVTDELIPETRGVSISGKIQYAEDGSAAPYALVYLSYIGSEIIFLCNYSDSAGRFYFTLPEGSGERELFISADIDGKGPLELFVDLDFCSDPVILPAKALILDSSDIKLIETLWINAQIQQQYPKEAPAKQKTEKDQERFFYGEPHKIILFNDFIRLPTLEEYFTEVTPEVSVKRVNRQKKLLVQGSHPELDFYAPLIMVDGVAIFDVDALLAISPRAVDRFEIINEPYIRGNVTFGGIINVVTKKGDLASIDLPTSGSLITYKLFGKVQHKISGDKPEHRRIPDSRNTLFWNADLSLDPGESKDLEFFTNDQEGNFQVLIRGYDMNGNYFEKSIPFTVD